MKNEPGIDTIPFKCIPQVREDYLWTFEIFWTAFGLLKKSSLQAGSQNIGWILEACGGGAE